MIKEPTASVFIFRQDAERGWLAALIWHSRLQCWLPAGGHVENGETAAEAAVREALEESGLDITLIPGPAVPLPAGFPHQPVPAPWWVTEATAAPDRHTGEPHVHVDHVFVATTVHYRPVREPEHQVRWFTAADIAATSGISQDSRLLATRLFASATQRPGPLLRWLPEPGHSAAAVRYGRGTTRTGFTSRTEPGSAPPARLIVIRGNSASGKSTVAAEIRSRVGRGLAIVGQDNLRRVVLREHDVPGGAFPVKSTC